MANSDALSTLVSWLSREILQPHVEKKPFGGYDVRVYPVLFGSVWLFEKGALLGRALSDRFDLLAKTLSTKPGMEERDAGEPLREAATDRIKRYGKEPDKFRDFWMKTEFPELDAIPLSDLKMAKRLAKEKCRLGEMIPRLTLWLLCGIGFGATYPELTERMWRQSHEMPPDPGGWELAERFGVVDGPWEPTPLEEMEHVVLVQFAYFLGRYFPESVERFDLVEELEEGRKDVERQ
jgi:hypothetical protein